MKIDITTKIFSQTTYLPLSLNNTVCIINLRQQFKRYVIDKSNGSITFNGFYPGPPLPISQIRLNLLNYKFTPFHLFPLLDSRLHDPSLSKYIAEVITGQASLSVGFLQRLFMFVNVVLTQEVFSVIPVSCLPKEETQEVEDESTCPICLENFLNDYVNDGKRIKKLAHCSHRFHKECISEWLRRCNSCPICRRIVLEESQQSYNRF
ncbi:unnamed protein product [Arabidopsis thaliana]|uniref:(thale cress) hypothetical protein n=1 Tax=Arabidopsis thaliana TaxID=3702 RepID=A0A7G2EEY8_ARATH|nr:unnamed protein product [Arabidopsis thaliana]